MILDYFPSCCGANILHDFFDSPEAVNNFLRASIASHPHIAFNIAILDRGQQKLLEDVFLKNGFKVVAEGYNYGKKIYRPLKVYIRTNLPPETNDTAS